MAEIVFYEKPGCGNNTRQKALLAAAGHHVIARNLLTEPWIRVPVLFVLILALLKRLYNFNPLPHSVGSAIRNA
ncbi:MAG: hypothetical protein GC149_12685 [Gammaproteobacteria bacterium]|nr:hypothetical protein [Gammaproteobacteria bacterium]